METKYAEGNNTILEDPMYTELTSRSRNVLKRLGIEKLEEIETFDYNDEWIYRGISRYRNLGEKSLLEICRFSKLHNINYFHLVEDYVKQSMFTKRESDKLYQKIHECIE